MKVEFYSTLWGQENKPLEQVFERIKRAGYDGVEGIVSRNDYKKVMTLLNEYDLKFIGHYAEPLSNNFEDCLKSYEDNLYFISSMNPVLINAQTGKDIFTFEQICKLIEKAQSIEKETGIPILHELHRGRFTYCYNAIKPFLLAFTHLKITADFSHWCCVSESYLQDQKEQVFEAIQRTEHIHARVGFPEGPQVNDPRAPEWKEALNYHLEWWDSIVEKKKGERVKTFTITPEFGPFPYMPHLPYTFQPVSDQWEINLFMKDLLHERYNVWPQYQEGVNV